MQHACGTLKQDSMRQLRGTAGAGQEAEFAVAAAAAHVQRQPAAADPLDANVIPLRAQPQPPPYLVEAKHQVQLAHVAKVVVQDLRVTASEWRHARGFKCSSGSGHRASSALLNIAPRSLPPTRCPAPTSTNRWMVSRYSSSLSVASTQKMK